MEFRSRRDLKTTWGPAEPLQWATVIGLVDSAREKNKARAVVEIYMNRGRYPLWACNLPIPLIERARHDPRASGQRHFDSGRSGRGIGDHCCLHAPGGRRLYGAGLEPVSRRAGRFCARPALRRPPEAGLRAPNANPCPP